MFNGASSVPCSDAVIQRDSRWEMVIAQGAVRAQGRRWLPRPGGSGCTLLRRCRLRWALREARKIREDANLTGGQVGERHSGPGSLRRSNQAPIPGPFYLFYGVWWGAGAWRRGIIKKKRGDHSSHTVRTPREAEMERSKRWAREEAVGYHERTI